LFEDLFSLEIMAKDLFIGEPVVSH
jgi:hypothetical protein